SAEAPGFAFVVRSMQIEFLKPARMDDVLEVVTASEEVKGASITLKQQILRADELLVEARVRVAFVCGGRGAAVPQGPRPRPRARQGPTGPRLSPPLGSCALAPAPVPPATTPASSSCERS